MSSALEETIEKVHGYSQKLVGNFKLIVVNPSPKLTDQEKHIIATSFGSSYQYQCIKTNTKIIMTGVLKRWNEKKSSARPIICALAPSETVYLKIY